MEYISSDKALLQHYGLKAMDEIDLHSWQFREAEAFDYGLIEKEIQNKIISPFLYLIIDLSIFKTIEFRLPLNTILERRYDLLGKTEYQRVENDKGRWHCYGVVRTDKEQMMSILRVIYELSYDTLVFGSKEIIDKTDLKKIAEKYTFPKTIIYPSLLLLGFEVLHLIRGNDGLSINLIQPKGNAEAADG